MHLLERVKRAALDFIFPPDQKTVGIELLSPGDILKTLPRPEKIPDSGTIALFEYDFPLTKEMIWRLKYEGNRRIAEQLGTIIFDAVLSELEDLFLESSAWREKRVLLVPIPVSGKRRLERGWNQAELLCEQMKKLDARNSFKYLPNQLVKNFHTESQTKTSSRTERLKNLKDSMRILNPSAVSGRCVVVVDDVTTTGATFNETRRALRAAGAKNILCVAVAH